MRTVFTWRENIRDPSTPDQSGGSSWTQGFLMCPPLVLQHAHTCSYYHTHTCYTFKHTALHICILHAYTNTLMGTDVHTYRWTLEALSTALPPPPGVFPMNSRPCVSHSSLGWSDGDGGHRQVCGPLLVPPYLWLLSSLTLGLEVAQVFKKSIQILGELRV